MKKKDHYLFWIRSSRGTDGKGVYSFPAGTPKDSIKHRLEQWCAGFPAWDKSENRISYGFKKVKIPPRRELLKKYDAVCKRKHKIESEWKTLAAMLNPRPS